MNKDEIQEKMRIAMCEEFQPWWYHLLEAYNDTLASWDYGNLLVYLEQKKELSIDDLSNLLPLYKYVIRKIPMRVVKEKKLEVEKISLAIDGLKFESLGQESQKAGYDNMET